MFGKGGKTTIKANDFKRWFSPFGDSEERIEFVVLKNSKFEARFDGNERH